MTTENVQKSFNTQPPEGGWSLFAVDAISRFCFNTQPPEGGWGRSSPPYPNQGMFQHTAARRRLEMTEQFEILASLVSTHSRPKAAGCNQGKAKTRKHSFNTQPPEGGWVVQLVKR